MLPKTEGMKLAVKIIEVIYKANLAHQELVGFLNWQNQLVVF